MFIRGYEEVEREKKRQAEIQENSNKKIFRFFLTESGPEATIQFLTEEPINCYMHTVQETKNGKTYYNEYVCTGSKNCPYCQSEDSKASLKGAYLIVDHRKFSYTDKNGKKKNVDRSVKLYLAGIQVLSQLNRYHTKYGLKNYLYDIARTGSKTNTTYSFDRLDSDNMLSGKEIKDLLPEKLQDEYDLTEKSLYAIVEEQLKMYIPKDTINNPVNNYKEIDDNDYSDDDIIEIDDDLPFEIDEPKKPIQKKPSARKLFKK